MIEPAVLPLEAVFPAEPPDVVSAWLTVMPAAPEKFILPPTEPFVKESGLGLPVRFIAPPTVIVPAAVILKVREADTAAEIH